MPTITGVDESGNVVSATYAVTSPAPTAKFCRVAYQYKSLLTIAQEAARYSIMDMQGDSTTAGFAAQLRAANPALPVLMYQDGFWAGSGDPSGVRLQSTWTEAQANPSWFVLDSSGSRITKDGTYFLMDVGNPSYQQEALAHALSRLQLMPKSFNGVFLDDAGAHLAWMLPPGMAYPPKYPTDTTWQVAVQSYLDVLGAGLRTGGYTVVGNLGGTWLNTSLQLWQKWQANLDGAMEEAFCYGTNRLPVSFTQWQAELQNVAWSEANGKLALLNADVGQNETANTYGLCSMLLIASGLSSWDTAVGGYAGNEYWPPENDQALALGTPLGAHSVLASQLRVRQFTGGTVLVNPLTTSLTDPTYGTIPAHTGQIR